MDRHLLETDPRFWVLSEALASYASDPDDPPLGDHGEVEAAVALVLRGGADLELLLIKRARSERDPWSEHMALPGGRRDPSDDSILETAVRETLEETGLDLGRHGALLGRLDEVRPTSTRLPRLRITPFVFGAHPRARASVASAEVQEVHWVTVAHLRAPSTLGEVEIPLPGGTRSFPCYRIGREVVWGLTYRILSQFLERYPDPELPPPPGGG